jgi:ribosomal protein L37AE/L43A
MGETVWAGGETQDTVQCRAPHCPAPHRNPLTYRDLCGMWMCDPCYEKITSEAIKRWLRDA